MEDGETRRTPNSGGTAVGLPGEKVLDDVFSFVRLLFLVFQYFWVNNTTEKEKNLFKEKRECDK